MSTPVPVPTPSPSPAGGGSVNITLILTILTIALNALATVPVVGADAKLAAVFIQIIQNAMQAYHQAAGAPLDLSKLPMELPVP